MSTVKTHIRRVESRRGETATITPCAGGGSLMKPPRNRAGYARRIADGYRPDRYDIAGAVICLIGVVVIVYIPRGT
jgi:hypothetical protein